MIMDFMDCHFGVGIILKVGFSSIYLKQPQVKLDAPDEGILH